MGAATVLPPVRSDSLSAYFLRALAVSSGGDMCLAVVTTIRQHFHDRIY